jgi:streptogramin lyase
MRPARVRWLVAVGVLGVVLAALPAAAAPATQEAAPPAQSAETAAPEVTGWDVKVFPPSRGWCPWGEVATGAGGDVWYAGSCGLVGHIAPDGRLDTVRVPDTSAATMLTDLDVSPNGDVWVTDANHALYRVTPELAVHKVDLPNQFAWKVSSSDDGSVWVYTGTFSHGDQLLRFDAAGRLAYTGESPMDETTIDIAAGPDGRVWVLGAAGGEGMVVALDPDHPQSQQRIALGLPAESNGTLIAGPDGSLWFSLWGPGTLGSIRAYDGDVTLHQTPDDFWLNDLAVGGPGDCGLWVTDYGSPGRIARIDPRGRTTYIVDRALAGATVTGSPTRAGIWFANGEHYGYLDPGEPGSC